MRLAVNEPILGKLRSRCPRCSAVLLRIRRYQDHPPQLRPGKAGVSFVVTDIHAIGAALMNAADAGEFPEGSTIHVRCTHCGWSVRHTRENLMVWLDQQLERGMHDAPFMQLA
jgi:hypothetical protein